jgi:hypothetical protein
MDQASWGPSDTEVGNALAVGFLPWMATQYGLTNSAPPNLLLWPDNAPSTPVDCDSGTCFRDNYTSYPLHTRFFLNGMYNPDQLRQRVFWALHKIDVTSMLS